MKLKFLIPSFLRAVSIVSPSVAGKLAWELFCRPRRSVRPEQEELFWRSGREIVFQSGRHARSWGTGPLIFFLHGWESRGSVFHKMIPMIVEAGFEAMAWDGPAHGDSPGHRTNMPHYTLSLAEDLKSSRLRPVAMVGHSLGGAAIGVWSTVEAAPRCSVLIAAPSRISGIFDRYTRFLGLRPSTAAALVRAAKKEIGFSVEERSLISLPLDRESKVLSIHDRVDKEIPFEDFQILQDIWPDAKFVATSGLGHKRIVKDAAVIASVVEFLSENLRNVRPRDA